jgi:hypothetical protein
VLSHGFTYPEEPFSFAFSQGISASLNPKKDKYQLFLLTVKLKSIDETEYLEVQFMFKACGIFAVSAILLIAIGGSADWLEGGYVRSGGSNEMAQYFTDPIFKSPARSYQSSGPALSKTQTSMDRSLRLGYVASRPATNKKTVTTPTQATTAAIRWSLVLSEGKTIYLELYLSGSRIFGVGSIAQGQTTYGASASGTISGSTVTMDVVPQTGTELYSIVFDLNKLHIPSAYTVHRAGALPATGKARMIRMP